MDAFFQSFGFDDPVTSLNYRRFPELISRLRQLSQSYQVIIFTHSIVLAAGLLMEFEEAGARDQISYYEVSATAGRKGLITPALQPRVDTPHKIGGEIDLVIKKASGLVGTEQAHEIERGYELIRSWVEAFVEKELFADVVQRYSPHIGIGKLANVKPDRLAAGELSTAATAKNVAIDPQTHAVWTTYTDGKSSFAKSWMPQK